jgi:hypothetical protein
LDIHFSSTFSTQNFKGFCGKTNIKINRKVEFKLKIHLEASVHCLSPPNTYSFVQEGNLDSTRKIVENYLLFTCITNKILTLHPWSVDWRNLSKTIEKEFLQPTCSECICQWGGFAPYCGPRGVLIQYVICQKIKAPKVEKYSYSEYHFNVFCYNNFIKTITSVNNRCFAKKIIFL